MQYPPSIILIIARTSGGKTHLARRISLASSRKKHFVVNQSASLLGSEFQAVSFEELSKLQNCSLIVDDCINLPPNHYTALAEVCNKGGRHSCIYPTTFCCHSIFSNNIFGLLRLVNYVILLPSAHPANARSVLTYSGLYTKAQVQVQVDKFIEAKDKFAIFLLDTINKDFGEVSFADLVRRLHIGDKKFEREVATTNQPSAMAMLDPHFLESLNRGSKILELSENPAAACLLFKFLCHNFADRLDMNDYSLTLKKGGKEGDKSERYSILDLSEMATTANKKPERKTILLLKFIKKRLLIPQTLIKNKFCRRILGFQ